jgi:hypothetical protein
MPTIELPLLLRRRVPHDAIECGHHGDGEYRQRGDKGHSFGHVTILITASASAQNADIQSQHRAKGDKTEACYRVSRWRFHIMLTREPAYRLHPRRESRA